MEVPSHPKNSIDLVMKLLSNINEFRDQVGILNESWKHANTSQSHGGIDKS